MGSRVSVYGACPDPEPMIDALPLDLMLEQPLGWLRASLPKMERASREIRGLARNMGGAGSLKKAREEYLLRRWRDVTGEEARDSRFSIIVPVHNEERSLPSFLGAMLASEIPPHADVLVAFILNASTDRGRAIIQARLAHINQPAMVKLPASAFDPNRSDSAFQVRCDGLRFMVVETSTPGKANALNLGNELALSESHILAINVDANNWVEPDSIAFLYGRAKQELMDASGSGAVIVNAREYCPTRNDQSDVLAKGRIQRAEVSGCLFAWSTHWIGGNNGFPQYAIEDYGTGLLALLQGKRIVESEAGIWVFTPSNPSDENRQAIRFIYGAMQLARQFHGDPAAMEVLLDDFHYLRPASERFMFYYRRKRKAGRRAAFIRAVFRWMLDEILIIRAHQMFRRDPEGQTWEPIRSTK